MPIHFYSNINIFSLETKNTSYVVGINGGSGIQCLHWGGEVSPGDCAPLMKPFPHSGFNPSVEKENEECSPFGGMSYTEPSLKVMFDDGVRDLKLVYSGHTIGEKEPGFSSLTIDLQDVKYGIRVSLIYHVAEELDLIERHCRITNTGDTAILIENASSAVWNIPGNLRQSYRLTHVSGKWAGESRLKRCLLTEGKKVLESRQGFTGHSFNPWFAIDDGSSNETWGQVWFGALAWSGNWKITVEKTAYNHVKVVGGINDFDFQWELKSGDTFETPVFTGGYSSSGFGEMSRKLHQYQLKHVLPAAPANHSRKVLYNSWEATLFEVKEAEQMELARKAAQIGAELFVVDDGWFGNRDSDRSGLGDWTVNRKKFPGGLTPLIEYVNNLGMDFGIWVEPEMVNPDSDLYRAHPDWVYSFPGRQGSLGRNQLVLNLSKNEVKEYILSFMTELLGKNNIAFIKWDMNRSFSECGWMEVSKAMQREIWVRHTRNLYSIWHELRQRFPRVVFESCSGGGGRIDMGIMRYADQFWTSDNTDAFDRLKIQEGYSYAYTPKAMVCWVTESPNYLNGRKLSLQYRFHSAMMGTLGIGANLNHWTEGEMEEASRLIRQYKAIRHIVQSGDLYRLASPEDGDICAVQYVYGSGAHSAVFLFSHCRQFGEKEIRIRLQGLDRDRKYTIEKEGAAGFEMQGGSLMHIGLPVEFEGDYSSELIRLTAL